MRMSMGATLKLRDGAPGKALAPGDRQATVIAVAAQKGGVGKTTTSTSLAAAWARHCDKRVLLIDLDPQGHGNLSLREQVLAGGGALSDVLYEPRRHEVEEITTATTVPGLFLTPPDPSLQAAEDYMTGRIGRELILRNAIEITRTHYDLIVVDCPPHIGALTLNALVAADHVLIPANPTALALAGIAGLLQTVEEVGQLNAGLGVLGVVLTRVDARHTRTNEAVLDMLRESWGDLVLPVQIGVNRALAEAQLRGQDIFAMQPGSRGARQYRDLATCLLARMGS